MVAIGLKTITAVIGHVWKYLVPATINFRSRIRGTKFTSNHLTALYSLSPQLEGQSVSLF